MIPKRRPAIDLKRRWKFRFTSLCILGLYLSPLNLNGNIYAQNDGQAADTRLTDFPAAGDSLRIQSAFAAPADSIRSFAPISINPKKAMVKSLLIPGGGQFANGSRIKGFLFVAAELVCLGGVIYETHLLGGKNLSPFDKELIKTDRNTFIIVWFGAKVFGMVDAYVDAQLKHFTVSDVNPPGMENSEAGSSNK
jgi:hypothetical protein